jgi:hypothetical protein
MIARRIQIRLICTLGLSFGSLHCAGPPLSRPTLTFELREDRAEAPGRGAAAPNPAVRQWLRRARLETFFADLVEGPQWWLASRGPCADTDVCFEEGRCSTVDATASVPESCAAVRQLDCLYSDACARAGRCRPEGGYCVEGDGDLLARLTLTPAERDVRQQSLQRTERAEQERGRGSCQGGLRRCPAEFGANILDCRHSESCDDVGRCYVRLSACVAATDTACRRSGTCRTRGQCHFDPDAAECHAR